MKGSQEVNLRARAALTSALAVALAGLLALLSFTGAAAADRDEEAAKKAGADKKIVELRDELEGLDSDLANVFVELQQIEAELGSAQAELDAAREELRVAEQELAIAEDQLAAAEATAAKLTNDLKMSAQQEDELNIAVGSMARDVYRGGPQNPLSLVISGEKTADINERTTAAARMSRAQTRALEEVRSSMATIRNQAERQEATTQRVAELTEAAQQKQVKAEELAADVEQKVSGLQSTKANLQERQSQWDARKAEAEAQLNEWQASRDRAAAKIAQIDEENRLQQLKFAEEQAAERSRQSAPAQSAPAVPAPSAPAGGGMFGYPLPAGISSVTSHYGWRIHPIFGTSRLHDGTDFGAACGSPQYAIRTGVVESSYFDAGGGNMVTINHGLVSGSSWVSQHLHLQSSAVRPGQQVNRGDVIGWTGSTGNSTGCHLHLTLYKNGSTVNPLDYL